MTQQPQHTPDSESAPQTPAKSDARFQISRFCKVALALTVLCGLLYLIQRLSVNFSDFFNTYISSLFRRVLSFLTCWFPFSLAEILLILLPVGTVALVIYAVKKRCDTWESAGKFLLTLVCCVLLLFDLFVLTFSAGYNTASIDKKAGLTRTAVSAEDLYRTAMVLTEKVNQASESIAYGEDDFSVMPYDLKEMNHQLMTAYAKLQGDYPFIDHFYSRVKPVMLSYAMSYTHITGVYSYFTGESNINVYFPDYTVPYTAAHELAHQRGISREDEANFVAFLVCTASEDAYLQYSGYLGLCEYVLNALYSANQKLYWEAIGTLKEPVRQEMRAYSAFFEQFRDNVAADVSGVVNDTFLKTQGTEGERSYGLVVDLAVAYYR